MFLKARKSLGTGRLSGRDSKREVILRILIHGINYTPEQIGIGKYTGEMAAWLAKQGHEVRVVTAPPYYPLWRVPQGYSAWRYRRESLAGVSVFRCPLWVPRKPTALKRLLHLASFAITSFPVMMRQAFWKPDIVMTVEPPLFCAPQALLASRLSGAKAWLHIQDFEVAAFFGLGFASSGFLKKCVTNIEGWLMRRFDLVSSISNAMIKRLTDLRVPEHSTYLFPNWVDTASIRPGPKGNDLRRAWGISDDKKIILYSGNLGKKQGLDMILEAAEGIARDYPEVVFLIVGDGATKSDLVADADRRGLRNVLFKPVQPVEKLPALLASANIHLVIQKRGAADAVMPSKLTGIFAAGGYTIITADRETELGRVVSGNPGIAELVEPENSGAFLEALLLLLRRNESTPPHNHIARGYAERCLSTGIVLPAFEKRLYLLTGASGGTRAVGE